MSENQENQITDLSSEDDLAKLFAKFMRNTLATNKTPENQNLNSYRIDTQPLHVGAKLNGENYSLWAVLMKKAIIGRGMVSHITGVPIPPTRTDPDYNQWVQADHCVFTWLIQGLEPRLQGRVSQQPTAKHVWDALATTYASGTDGIQVWDLQQRASLLRQGNGSLEEVWSTLQEIWLEIDQRRTNPMKCSECMEIHDKWTQDQRLYQLLIAVSNKYDTTKKEIIKMVPLPTLEYAYGMIRREEGNTHIFQPGVTNHGGNTEGIGTGFAARGRQGPPGGSRGGGGGRGTNWNRRIGQDEDRSKLVCTQCGRKRHTKSECFEIVRYPDWWEERTGKPPPSTGPPTPWSRGGHAVVAAAEEKNGSAIHGESSTKRSPEPPAKVATNSGAVNTGAAHLVAGGGTVAGNWAEDYMEMEKAAPPFGKLGFGADFKSSPNPSSNIQFQPISFPKFQKRPHFKDNSKLNPQVFENSEKSQFF